MVAPFAVLYTRGGDMKPLKKKVSITLDEDLVKQLQTLAEENDRSLSQFINLILKAYMKSQEKN